MACYQRPTLVLTIHHTSELATSLATSTRLHTLGLQSGRLHPVAAVAAPAYVPQYAEERRERSAGPGAGPPVLASVPLGEHPVRT
jgi:ABC-type Na+ efflux pump permease subunit